MVQILLNLCRMTCTGTYRAKSSTGTRRHWSRSR